jgi:hypothetical protein
MQSRLDHRPHLAHSHDEVNNAHFIIQVSKGLIRDQRARRTLMFWNIVVVLGLIFLGATLLWSWLREHPLFFLGYWAFCAWLTLLAVLLALYDVARVRLDAQRARRQLEEECFSGPEHDDTNDSHTP